MLHALLDLVQLQTSHKPLDRHHQSVIDILWMIHPVLIGNQGVEKGTDLDQMTNRFVFACETIDLETGNKSDVIERYLRNEPSEVVASDTGGSGFAEISIEHANTVFWPAPIAAYFLGAGFVRERFQDV